MAALLSEFEYDIFISYRQNDNRYDGWVTDFVENLQKELVATIKANISVYFDENPHDGLLETHEVDESLKTKLKCLIFIPIISQTYCDPNCFAWQNEFLVFRELADNDQLGRKITLPNGNVSSRILPVKIHNLDSSDQQLLESELGGPIRAIDFIHESPGVNRPLDSKHDNTYSEQNKTIYRDQINKVANSVKEILIGIKDAGHVEAKPESLNPKSEESIESMEQQEFSIKQFGKSLLRRNIPQVVLAYSALSVVVYRLLSAFVNYNNLPEVITNLGFWVLIIGGIVATTIAWLFEFSPEGLIRTKSWQSRLNPYPGYKRKPFTGIATFAALILVLILQTVYSEYFPSVQSSKDKFIESKSIAVIPFENQGEDEQYSYLGKDLTDNITVQLIKVSALSVYGYSSTSLYNANALNLNQIGQDLGVSVILTGSVRRFGNQLRILCQLVDVNTSQILWGENYNRDMVDIYDIQIELVKRIAEVLSAPISESEKLNLNIKPTNLVSAHDHYLKGRKFYLMYEQRANDIAIKEFKSAIRLDSNYALAWSGLGDAFSQKNFMYGEAENWNDSSIYAGTRAVKLDPSSAEAYKALGNAYNYELRYDKAREYFTRAVELNPNYGPAVGNLGSVYQSLGQLDKSIEWQLKGARLSPNSFIPSFMLGWTYRLIGDLDKSEKWLLKSLRQKPFADTYRELGYTYILKGKESKALEFLPLIVGLDPLLSRNYVEAGLVALFANEIGIAQEYFSDGLELNGDLTIDPYSIAPLALAYFKLNTDKHVDALIELERLKNMYLNLINSGSEDDDHRIYLASIYTMLGNDKEALEWFKMAINANWTDISMIDHIPWFQELKNYSRLKETLRPLKKNLAEMKSKSMKLE